jgi:CspA family cold shock protein
MASGTCKWFSAPKGFGFITSDDGTDYFVHQSDITMGGFRKLLQGQRVTYTLTNDANGRAKAAGVVPSSPPKRFKRRSAPRDSNSAAVARPQQPTPPATNHGVPIGFSPANGADLVPSVIKRATLHYGWTHHTTQPQQGHLVILHKPNPNGGVKLMKLNIWCTRGTVGSYLKHPKQGNTSLFRREISTWAELDEILANPRVHTDKGYQRKRGRPPRK